ncbi:hypothetical protein Sjap_023761 [Stephania japonica]|uniref:Uncharacterized protein n=1 Tax=Stephania japonica TaxID=461633 RepID=A0AAP0HKT7_9MAGN
MAMDAPMCIVCELGYGVCVGSWEIAGKALESRSGSGLRLVRCVFQTVLGDFHGVLGLFLGVVDGSSTLVKTDRRCRGACVPFPETKSREIAGKALESRSGSELRLVRWPQLQSPAAPGQDRGEHQVASAAEEREKRKMTRNPSNKGKAPLGLVDTDTDTDEIEKIEVRRSSKKLRRFRKGKGKKNGTTESSPIREASHEIEVSRPIKRLKKKRSVME